MKVFQRFVALGVALLLTQATFAAQNNSCGSACPPKECPKPCPKPCPPAPCKPVCPTDPCCPKPCFERGYPTSCECTPSAYNEPAGFDLGPCPWDVWADVSFTYWLAEQEGMDIAVNTALNDTGIALLPVDGTVLFQDTSFKPGFKVGLGADVGHDDWNVFAEYTWFRSRTHQSRNPPVDPRVGTALAPAGESVWDLHDWFAFGTRATNVTSTWRLRMDLLDVGASRPYYQGKSLIIAPFGGLRAAWIRQNLNISIHTFNLTNTPLDATSHNRSHSWALGPRGGFQAKWHLGAGFRFEGDVAGSVLFTQYTKVRHTETPTTVNNVTLDGPISVSRFSNYNCLRACTEMNLGLGWGSYFDCYNFHWDIVATYDFQVFWNQNIMRQLVDTVNNQTGHSTSNLYLQGLTLATRFDF